MAVVIGPVDARATSNSGADPKLDSCNDANEDRVHYFNWKPGSIIDAHNLP
jgi:hypothetical protein